MQDLVRERVMHALLERQAAKYGDRTYLYYKDHEFSYQEVNEQANLVAKGLQELGVKKGDKVAIVMDICPEVIFLVFGLSKLGAVAVLLNTAHKGDIMTYMLDNSDSCTLVINSHLFDRVKSSLSKTSLLQSVVVLRSDNNEQTTNGINKREDSIEKQFISMGKEVIEWFKLINNDGKYQPVDVVWSDPIMILYTAGTTGQSKGVLLPHNLLYSQAERKANDMLELNENARIHNALPFFHAHAWHSCINPSLYSGGQVVLSERFSASNFWNEIRRFGCTHSLCVGAVTSILFKAEPRSDDADNPLQVFVGGPTSPEIFEAFQERFGVTLAEFYGSTELGTPIMNLPQKRKVGSCGKTHPDYAVKIVDDNGVEVESNVSGEILVRPLKPYSMMLEYYKVPDKTVETWNDLWFHTGDCGFFDEEGYLFFTGRKKDAIRRRGENISAFEVEKVINAHPSVLEAAVIGVESELGDDEVMVCLVLKAGENLSCEELIRFCKERMAYFMVPRYIRFMDELPKTPSLRVEKYKLRDEGITSDTWDSEKSA